MTPWELTNTVATTSGELRWERLGTADGPPVVLLHGTPFSSFIWRRIAPSLGRHHPVYVWDMPSYGNSEKFAGQDLSLETLARIFTQLLDHWALQDPIVIAHDSGGAVALGAHLQHGARYQRLALVDAVALPPWGSPFFTLVGNHAEVFARLPANLHDALIREYIGTASSPGLHPTTHDILATPWLDAPGQSAFYRQLAQRRDDPHYIDQIQNDYPGISLPVLVCWGVDDTWIPVERGRELAHRLPAARLEILPSAGHLVQEDNPAQLTAALLDFLPDQG